MAARTTDHKVHMMVIVTMSGSAFGMASAAAKTAAMLRVPIPSARDFLFRNATITSGILTWRPMAARFDTVKISTNG